jgi:hypothetical protein
MSSFSTISSTSDLSLSFSDTVLLHHHHHFLLLSMCLVSAKREVQAKRALRRQFDSDGILRLSHDESASCDNAVLLLLFNPCTASLRQEEGANELKRVRRRTAALELVLVLD